MYKRDKLRSQTLHKAASEGECDYVSYSFRLLFGSRLLFNMLIKAVHHEGNQSVSLPTASLGSLLYIPRLAI
jgi:hypothetical protein